MGSRNLAGDEYLEEVRPVNESLNKVFASSGLSPPTGLGTRKLGDLIRGISAAAA
jgi:hypothetical protein